MVKEILSVHYKHSFDKLDGILRIFKEDGQFILITHRGIYPIKRIALNWLPSTIRLDTENDEGSVCIDGTTYSSVSWVYNVDLDNFQLIKKFFNDNTNANVVDGLFR